MGKIGLLADAHGNHYGLRACIDALRGREAEALYFLGDAVGYLPFAEEVLTILRAEDVICQLGNHEAMLCGLLPLSKEKDVIYQLGMLLERLPPATIHEISLWPSQRSFIVNSVQVTLLHGGPSNALTEYVYPNSNLSRFADLNSDIVFVGNTHIPFTSTVGTTRVVNVGSCGLPRDGTNEASCVLFDPVKSTIELLRIRFDASALISEALRRGPVADAVIRRLINN